MTRILVVSDSHGDEWKLRAALQKEPTAEIIFHLGDGAREAESISRLNSTKFFHTVCGNCDWGSNLPESVIDEIEGKRIYACHGHAHLVKYGISDLLSAAKAQNCSIALYGHTHKAVTDYRDGLYIMNPGSIRSGDYGAIDITEKGIYLSLLEV